MTWIIRNLGGLPTSSKASILDDNPSSKNSSINAIIPWTNPSLSSLIFVDFALVIGPWNSLAPRSLHIILRNNFFVHIMKVNLTFLQVVNFYSLHFPNLREVIHIAFLLRLGVQFWFKGPSRYPSPPLSIIGKGHLECQRRSTIRQAILTRYFAAQNMMVKKDHSSLLMSQTTWGKTHIWHHFSHDGYANFLSLGKR